MWPYRPEIDPIKFRLKTGYAEADGLLGGRTLGILNRAILRRIFN